MFLGASQSDWNKFAAESGIRNGAQPSMEMYSLAAKYGLQAPDVDAIGEWPYGTMQQWIWQNGVPDLTGQPTVIGASGTDPAAMLRDTALQNGWVNAQLEPISPTDLTNVVNFARSIGVDPEAAMGWAPGTINKYMTGTYLFPSQQQTISDQISLQDVAARNGWVVGGRLASVEAARALIAYGRSIGLGPTEIDAAFGWAANTVLAYSRLGNDYVVDPEIFDTAVVAPPVTAVEQNITAPTVPAASSNVTPTQTITNATNSSGPASNVSPTGNVNYSVPVAVTQNPDGSLSYEAVVTNVSATGPVVNTPGSVVATRAPSQGGGMLALLLAAIAMLS